MEALNRLELVVIDEPASKVVIPQWKLALRPDIRGSEATSTPDANPDSKYEFRDHKEIISPGPKFRAELKMSSITPESLFVNRASVVSTAVLGKSPADAKDDHKPVLSSIWIG
jgi:hypothetical protein